MPEKRTPPTGGVSVSAHEVTRLSSISDPKKKTPPVGGVFRSNLLAQYC